MPRNSKPARKAASRNSTKSAKVHEMPRRDAKQQSLKQPKAPYPAQHQDKPGLESEMKMKPKYFGDSYRPAGKLKGKCALITGADSGIGRSVAVLYAREGADVAIVYLPQEQRDADETRDAVESVGRRCLLIPGDVTDPEFCKSAVETAVEELGKLDILV